MTERRLLAILTAGLTVAAMVSAPAAGARPTCRTNGNSTICESNGSISIAATPGPKAPPANRPQLPWIVWD
jgi:hypothetical protein